MKRQTLMGMVILVMLIGSYRVHAIDTEWSPTAISSVLFPDTATWSPVDKMHRPDLNYLFGHQQHITTAYSKSKIAEKWSTEGCSMIGRIFSDNNNLRNYFFLFDGDGDGIEDIIYTGSAQCAEGDITIIWFGDGNGFRIRQDILWPMLALRIKAGKEFLVSSVAIGCCGDPTDEYFVGPLLNFRNKGHRKIYTGTVMPYKVGKTTRFSAHKNGIVLRSSPKIDDKYDENRSGLLANAVFGNVLSKYIPGCEGDIVGQYKDNKLQLWYFVLLDDSCNYSKTHDPYGANAGWVKASSIQTKNR